MLNYFLLTILYFLIYRGSFDMDKKTIISGDKNRVFQFLWSLLKNYLFYLTEQIFTMPIMKQDLCRGRLKHFVIIRYIFSIFYSLDTRRNQVEVFCSYSKSYPFFFMHRLNLYDFYRNFIAFSKEMHRDFNGNKDQKQGINYINA